MEIRTAQQTLSDIAAHGMPTEVAPTGAADVAAFPSEVVVSLEGRPVEPARSPGGERSCSRTSTLGPELRLAGSRTIALSALRPIAEKHLVLCREALARQKLAFKLRPGQGVGLLRQDSLI